MCRRGLTFENFLTLFLNRYPFRDEPPIVRLESTGGSVPAKTRDGTASDAPNTFGSGVSFAALYRYRFLSVPR